MENQTNQKVKFWVAKLVVLFLCLRSPPKSHLHPIRVLFDLFSPSQGGCEAAIAALHCQKVRGDTAEGEGGYSRLPSFMVTWPILLWPGHCLVGMFREREDTQSLS